MDYDLKPISKETVDSIKDGWFKQLDDFGEEASFLNSSVERIIDWCEKVISDAENFLWDLHSDGTTRAIVETVDASKSKDPSFKFLNVYVEPRLILDHKDEVRKEDLQEVVEIFTFAMVSSMRLAQENGIQKLKVFGRTDEMRSLFDSLVVNADPDKIGFDIFRQGKWLVICEIG